ncbi:MAG: hypothetical protein NC924_01055 [Candidatus Omnitrophica bacterium]|nr:hypothetical protein [Candidatus Omnitrophota bacterium]
MKHFLVVLRIVVIVLIQSMLLTQVDFSLASGSGCGFSQSLECSEKFRRTDTFVHAGGVSGHGSGAAVICALESASADVWLGMPVPIPLSAGLGQGSGGMDVSLAGFERAGLSFQRIAWLSGRWAEEKARAISFEAAAPPVCARVACGSVDHQPNG